jgi:hypothetical protein
MMKAAYTSSLRPHTYTVVVGTRACATLVLCCVTSRPDVTHQIHSAVYDLNTAIEDLNRPLWHRWKTRALVRDIRMGKLSEKDFLRYPLFFFHERRVIFLPKKRLFSPSRVRPQLLFFLYLRPHTLVA